MSEPLSLHRGHTALLGIFRNQSECNASLRNGTIQFDGHSQDFLVGWYEDLKGRGLIEAEDWLGRTGAKLGEKVTITDSGRTVLQQV